MKTTLQTEISEHAQPSPAPAPPAVEPQVSPEQIVRMFSSRDAEERNKAEQALQDMGPAAVEALLEVVQAENAKRRRHRKYRYYTMGGGIFLVVLGPIIYSLATRDWGIFQNWYMYSGVFSGMGGGAALAMGSTHKSAAKVLAKIGDIRAVGTLTDMLNEDDKDIRAASEEALTRLLPRITAEDAKLISPEQVQTLCWAIGKRNNPWMAIAILQAMNHVGNADSLPTIRAIAAGGRGAAALEEVQQAAKNCIPAIEARLTRERDAQTLLRPSGPADKPSETLLRPASDASDTDQKNLLRPAN